MKRLGVFTPALAGSYYSGLAAALYREASRAGAATLLLRTGRLGASYGGSLSLDQADAWVSIGESAAPELLLRIAASGRPVSVIGHDFGLPQLGSVWLDNRAGIFAAMQWLYDHGHRQFAFVGADSTTDLVEREAAFSTFVASHEGCQDAVSEKATDWCFSAGYEATSRLLARDAPFTALIASTDSNALGALSALRAAGLMVPVDAAVAGFDNSIQAQMPGDGIASVDQHLGDMAAAAFADVAARLADPGRPPVRRLCLPSFIPRHSSGDPDPPTDSLRSSNDIVLSFIAASQETSLSGITDLEAYLRIYPCQLWPRLSFARSARYSDKSRHAPIKTLLPGSADMRQPAAPPRPASEREFPFSADLPDETITGDLVLILPDDQAEGNTEAVALAFRASSFTEASSVEVLIHEIESFQQQLRVLGMREVLASTIEALHKTQGELLRAEKNAALSVVIAGIAHRLNTPLGNCLLAVSSLTSEAGLMRQAYEDGQLKRSDIARVLATLDRTTGLLERNIGAGLDLVANFKQVASVQAPGAPSRFELQRLVGDHVGTLEARCQAGGARLILATDDQPIVMESHAQQLAQVLSELVDNAVVHGVAGRKDGQVRMSATRSGEQVRIMVEDNGAGVAAQDLERVFDPFFTATFTSSSGLGLTMVRNIVTEVLGGRVWVESTPGQGTRFVVELPLTASPRGG